MGGSDGPSVLLRYGNRTPAVLAGEAVIIHQRIPVVNYLVGKYRADHCRSDLVRVESTLLLAPQDKLITAIKSQGYDSPGQVSQLIRQHISRPIFSALLVMFPQGSVPQTLGALSIRSQSLRRLGQQPLWKP